MRKKTHVATFVALAIATTLATAEGHANVRLAQAATASAQTTYQFNLPEQPLAEALRAIGQQTATNILFDPDTVLNRTAPALRATLTTSEAISRVLKDSGLTIKQSADTVLIRTNGQAATTRTGPQTISLILAQNAGSTSLQNGEEPVRKSMDSAPTETESSSQKGVQEIIVTATKREERLLDVPMSIGVVTAEEIDQRHLVSAEDYLRGIPGVSQTPNGVFGDAITIRGLETSRQSQNLVAGTTVATYFGETPTTTSRGISGGTNIDTKLVDIERVEVLRGPQGTAFGSSAMGGAVRTIPVDPKLDRFEGKAAVGYSQTSGMGSDNNNIQGVINVPLIDDKLAIRAVAFRFEDTGYYRNVAGSDPTFRTAVVNRYGAQAYAVDEEHAGSNRFLGGRLAALYQATSDLRFKLTYLKQKIEQDGVPLQNSGRYEQVVFQVAPEHYHRGRTGPTNDSDIEIANATAEYGLGWGNLLMTYSYIDSGSTPVFNGSTLGSVLVNPISSSPLNKQQGNIGEVRLTTDFDGPWNFLGGLYSENLDDQANWTYYWIGDPQTQPNTTAFPSPHIRFLATDDITRNLKQKAAFGEASWKFLPGFTFTAGVRAYDYDRTELRVRGGTFLGQPLSTPRENKDSGTTYRANLSYKPNNDALIYAGWSQGFRLGMTQVGVAAGSCDLNGDGVVDGTNITIASTQRTDSDTVDSYEIGVKLASLDNRLIVNADVYRMDWNNLPVNALIPAGAPNGCAGTAIYTVNAGGARAEGIELQANFYLTKAFRVDVGGAKTRSRLTTDVPQLRVLAGARLPAPEVNANLGVRYELEMGGHKAFVRADYVYVGSFYGSGVTMLPGSKTDAYGKVDASARVELWRNLDLDLFVRNVTNADDFTWRGNFSSAAPYGFRLQPRTVGLQVGYRFD